jgi:hypothetical protein
VVASAGELLDALATADPADLPGTGRTPAASMIGGHDG